MMQILKSILIKSFELFLFIYEQLSSFLWLIFLYPIYCFYLRKKGYSKISPFQYSGWHLSCRYLLVYKDDKKYFVKCGKYFLMKNEVTAIKAITKLDADCVAKLYDSKLSHYIPINFVIIEFLDSYTPFSKLT